MGFDFSNITGFTNITMEVDSWSAWLADSRIRCGGQLGNANGAIHSLFQERARIDGGNSEKESRRVRTLSEGLTREMFAMLYNGGNVGDMVAPAPDSEWVQEAHGAANQIDEFHTLCQQVAGDPDMAALATAKMLDAVAKVLPLQIKKEKAQERERKRKLAAEQLGIPMGGKSKKKDDGPSADDLIRAAMRKAARDGTKDINEVRSAMAGVAPGTETAPPQYEQDDTRRMELAMKLLSDERLRKVMQMAGRLRRMADANRQVRDPAGRTEVVGVTTGNDLIRALPSELAMLRIPALRTAQLLKIAESKMAQYKMEGVERLGRGPIIVMVDCSGSMNTGERMVWASACSLACMGTATKQKRPCTLLGFNKKVIWVYRIDADGRAWEGDGTEVVGGAKEVALRLATMSGSGGTHFQRPFQAALDMEEGAEKDRADLVLITDGHAELPDGELVDRLQAAKKRGLRVFGLTVGGGSLSYSVSQLCDYTVDIDKTLNAKEVASALP